MLSQLRKSYDLRLWRPRIFSKLSLFFEEKWKMYPSRGRRGSTSCSKYWRYIHDFSPHIGDTIFVWRSPPPGFKHVCIELRYRRKTVFSETVKISPFLINFVWIWIPTKLPQGIPITGQLSITTARTRKGVIFWYQSALRREPPTLRGP